MSKKGQLFVISGPSGVGKGTVVKKLIERNPALIWSVSSTTRQPRNGEVDGKDYYFLDRATFENKISQGDFIEWAKVHGNLYGTQKVHLEENLSKGKGLLLEIDVQGAQAMKKNMPDSIFIFLTPPSADELLKRLKGRNSETEETLKTRLATAKKELEHQKMYDYIIENKALDKTVKEIEKIISKHA